MSAPVESPMHTQHLLADPYDKPLLTVKFRAVVSRDQLAAAVDLGLSTYNGGDRHPDTWTVAEVRYHAESQILAGSGRELQEGAEAMAEMARPDFYDPWTRERVQAVYRAVDRAFPGAGGIS
ncbi:hypothetical protein [Streptomyces mesophilus]|uniref:hypothetical protein n=1 Tax=Streptomyces mesophilus TaxID=1775132 RepID=UPI00331D75FF